MNLWKEGRKGREQKKDRCVGEFGGHVNIWIDVQSIRWGTGKWVEGSMDG